MKVDKLASKEFTIFEVNSPDPVIEFNMPISKKNTISKKLSFDRSNEFSNKVEDIEISEKSSGITIRKGLRLDEHILGLGEKAFEIERRRISVRMWNNDSYSYGWYTDPLYASIPFFISVNRGAARGFFVNSCSNVTFDIGVLAYDKIVINIPEPSVRFYLIEGPSIERVLENFSTLTGKPFVLPEWALGHQISRYSYYPQASVFEVVKQYKKQGFPVSCVYLDIDYTDDMKILTWNKERFPNPRAMIKELHSLGTRVVVNIGPGIKIDQDYEIFRKGMGLYCKTTNNEAYIAPLWAGNCAFPDFVNGDARKFWTTQIKKFVSSSGLDGAWLDMNEPSVFTKSKTFDEEVVHRRDNGKRLEHKLGHNAYSYFESEATFEALKEISEEPFILTRGGCAGIQKYAAVWSGDNVASWENMRLQIPLLLSLSLSGVPYVGCDIGGFIGRSDHELVTRFYEMALFFPIFRNHKGKDGNDQEAYRLPVEYRDRVRKAIELRYSFFPYLFSLAQEAHQTGHPIIRPLSYEFQRDDDTYAINDEYMIGKSLLYAPIVEKGRKDRDLYLPEGKWQSWHMESSDVIEGEKWITSQEEMPLYVRFGSIVPTKEKIVVWGPSSFVLHEGRTSIDLKSDALRLTASKVLSGERVIEFKESQSSRVSIDKTVLDAEVRNNSTLVKSTKFKEIKLLSV
jgi:alpha-glucosidase